MDSDFDRRIRELFDGALELPDAARPSFLEERCGGDARLRREVESLLGMASTVPGFLDRSPVPPGSPASPVPERIGPYVIVGKLGQGGMGVVHRARDQRDGRMVALKTIQVQDASVLAAIRREV